MVFLIVNQDRQSDRLNVIIQVLSFCFIFHRTKILSLKEPPGMDGSFTLSDFAQKKREPKLSLFLASTFGS